MKTAVIVIFIIFAAILAGAVFYRVPTYKPPMPVTERIDSNYYRMLELKEEADKELRKAQRRCDSLMIQASISIICYKTNPYDPRNISR